MDDASHGTAAPIVSPGLAAPPKARWLDWLPVFGTIVTMFGFVWMAAGWVSEVQDDTRRITALEAIRSDARLARIEAKVDILLDQKERRK